MNLVFRYYLTNRIFILTDLALVVVPIIFLIVGWSKLYLYSTQLAFAAGVCLALLFLLGFFCLADRAYLASKKKHIDMRLWEAQQLWEERVRQGMLPPSPKSTSLLQISPEEEDVSQQSQSGVAMLSGVAPSQGVAVSQAPQDRVVDECNVAVAYYLADHPYASIREVEVKTKYSKRTIGRTPAWQNRKRYR